MLISGLADRGYAVRGFDLRPGPTTSDMVVGDCDPAAMRERGIRRVYASSHHAVGWHARAEMLGVDARPRPDTFSGVGKVAAKALVSLYVDRYGLSAACLRIGSFLERPTSRRHLATWLSYGDAVRLVDACLTAPDLGYRVVYGTSGNTRVWWDLAPDGLRVGGDFAGAAYGRPGFAEGSA
ncbi:MAG: hypothetical protein ABJC62_08830 [Frankiaceae bacterium]